MLPGRLQHSGCIQDLHTAPAPDWDDLNAVIDLCDQLLGVCTRVLFVF